VHAVGQGNGMNYLVMVAKEQVMESIRVAEAATCIR
jgi:hypothetical protein